MSSDKALQQVFKPVADTYVDRGRSTTNYGRATELGVDSAPDAQRALIRFTVPAMSEAVQSAKLRLFVTNGSADGPKIVLTGNSWTETGVTYATQPSSAGPVVANVANAPPGWLDVDVSHAVKGAGTYSFYLLHESDDGFRFPSREGANPPQLVLTTGGTVVVDPRSDPGQGTSSGSGTNLSFPVRGAFYYPWYPATWTVNKKPVKYHPILGKYDSGDINAIDRHLDMMAHAKINLAIASWWGKGTQSESTRIKRLLERTVARGSKVKWAFLYEDEGFENPSSSQIASDLDYLRSSYASSSAIARIDGKPLVFVYAANDSNCSVATRWARANRRDWFVNLKLFPGFADCADQPNAWHQYGLGSHNRGHSYVIAPGFWRADQSSPKLARDLNRFSKSVRDMVASRERWQLIVSFNEWGEGTAVEPATEWQSNLGYGKYLDALHADGQ